MTRPVLRDLAARVRGRVEFDMPLAGFTTYRIGGPAAALVHAANAEDVVEVLRFAAESDTRWFALGLGSNILVSDAGFDGIVVRLGKGVDRIDAGVGGDEHVWRVGAGLPTPLLARRTAKAGFAGVHRLIGVPGSVGGGVFMNAGAHGQDFSQVVRRVELVGADGEVREVRGTDIAWRYRTSGLDGIVLGATLELTPGDPAQLDKEIRAHFKWRKQGTPFNEPCCGSVFRNPVPPATTPQAVEGGPGRPKAATTSAVRGRPWPPGAARPGGGEGRTAGQLIDACGLKGFTIGGAQVSPMHANYIVNVGGATAGDVLAVIDAVRNRVAKECGIELALEVKIVA